MKVPLCHIATLASSAAYELSWIDLCPFYPRFAHHVVRERCRTFQLLSAARTAYQARRRSCQLTDSSAAQADKQRVYLLPSLTSPPSVFWPNQPTSTIDGAFSTAPLRETLPRDEGGVILKHRFPKTYRHPTLNSSLTKSRLSYEARALARCAKSGLNVPKVLWVDEKAGVLGLERIRGWSIREILGGGAEGEIEGDVEEELADGEDAPPGEPAGGLAGVNGPGEDNEGARAIASAGISLGEGLIWLSRPMC